MNFTTKHYDSNNALTSRIMFHVHGRNAEETVTFTVFDYFCAGSYNLTHSLRLIKSFPRDP